MNTKPGHKQHWMWWKQSNEWNNALDADCNNYVTIVIKWWPTPNLLQTSTARKTKDRFRIMTFGASKITETIPFQKSKRNRRFVNNDGDPPDSPVPNTEGECFAPYPKHFKVEDTACHNYACSTVTYVSQSHDCSWHPCKAWMGAKHSPEHESCPKA